MAEAQVTSSKILASKICKNTLKIIPNFEKDKAVLFSSVMVPMIGTLLKDGKIHILEIKFLKTYIQKLFPLLSPGQVDELIDMQITCNEKSNEIDLIMNDSISYLNEVWKQKEKFLFAEALFVMARIDLNLSKQEMSYINSITKKFGFDEACCAGLKMNAQLALDKALGEDGSDLYIVKGKDRFLGKGW